MTITHATIDETRLQAVEQPLLYQHCRIDMPNRQMLGEGHFRLERFQGSESVSDLFEYHLELHADSDESGLGIEFSEIIGRPITVGIACTAYEDRTVAHQAFLQALDGSSSAPFALFNGIVASFAIDIPGVYRIVMRPAAWRMGLTNHYRVFTQKSLRDVLSTLCRDHGIDASFDGLAGPQNLASTRIQDWLQAGETDLEFLRRLMGKAHVYYYFLHEAARHTMVFDNRPMYPAALPEGERLHYTWTSVDPLGEHQLDMVTHYSYQQSLGISGVQGVFSQQNEAWDVRQPGQPLATWADFRADSRGDTGDLPFHQYKIVQYGFSDAQVREYARATELAMHTANLQLDAGSRCPLLRVGHRVTIAWKGLKRRPELEGREFVLTHVQHDSNLDGEYTNQFTATPSSGLVSVVGIQDTQQGVVLAHVVDAGGSDAIRHWPYYIPDDFAPGQQTLVDTQAVQRRLNAKGVHVRFSCDAPDAPPVWIKLASHMQTVPEVGCAVWVTRANDESELPEIQSIVQADGSSTVVDTRWTAHTQVGNSYSTSYGDSRSIRFGQPWSAGDVDKAVTLVEDAYARGEFRDASYSRGGNYGYSTSEDREKGMLSESWSYGSTYSYGWSAEQRSYSASGTSHHESVVGKSDPDAQTPSPLSGDATSAVQSSLTSVWGDVYSKSDTYGNTKSESLYDGRLDSVSTHTGDISNITTQLANSTNVMSSLGVSTNIGVHDTEIGMSTTALQANLSSVLVSASYSSIGATNSSSTTGASVSSNTVGLHTGTDITGVSSSTSITGVANRMNLVGVTADTSLTGAASNTGIVGAESRVSVTGASSTVSVIGANSTVNVVGTGSTVEIIGPSSSVSIKSDQSKVDLDGDVIQIPIIVLVL